MRPEVKSNKKKTVVYRTQKLVIGDYTITEQYTDEVLMSQNWSVKGGFKKSHPGCYEPTRLYFQYYSDIEWTKDDKCVNLNGWCPPSGEMVVDWDSAKIDHVICNWVGMDGCIYVINKPDPVPLWRSYDYISAGFENHQYDLDKVVKKMKSYKSIRNVRIAEIPSYNQFDGRTHAIEFEYKSRRPVRTISRHSDTFFDRFKCCEIPQKSEY